MVREIKSNEYRKVIIIKLRFQGVFRPLELKKAGVFTFFRFE